MSLYDDLEEAFEDWLVENFGHSLEDLQTVPELSQELIELVRKIFSQELKW